MAFATGLATRSRHAPHAREWRHVHRRPLELVGGAHSAGMSSGVHKVCVRCLVAAGGVFGMYAARLGTSLRCGSIAVYLYYCTYRTGSPMYGTVSARDSCATNVFTTRFMCDLNAYQVFTKVVKVYFEKYFTYEP